MVDLIRVGVLGLGKMGKLHFLNAISMKDVKVVAAADKNRSSLKMAESCHVKVYDDYEKLLNNEQLDAVIISLPNFLREESITFASEKKLDIFVDKPLARNLNEAKNIVQKVNLNGARLMVGINYRYIDSVQKIKRILDEGRLGDIVIATGDLIMDGPFSHPLVPKPIPEWWFDRGKTGGGALLDLGYHLIDIFQWMFGELDILYSDLQYRFNLPLEDSATVILRSRKTSTRIVINLGWFSKMIFPNFNFRINLHGTVGYTCTDRFAPRNLYLHALKEGSFNFLRKTTGKSIDRLSYTYYYASYAKILELFFESIKNDVSFPLSLEEQLHVIEVIEDVYRRNGVTLSA